MRSLVTVGETMARLSTPYVGRLRHVRSLDLGIAGAESNVAIGFARLGGDASWTGRVGEDEFGALVESTIRGQGVRTRAVHDRDAPTGLMLKEHRSADLSNVVYYRDRSAGSRLAPDDLDEAAIASADVVHLTGITAALSTTALEAVHCAAAAARSRGTALSFDLNYRAALWSPADASKTLRQLVETADIVFATEDEARLIVDGADTAELARALAALGPVEVVIKRAERGSTAVIDDELLESAAVPVTAIDPVGAGDAFAAGYLYERTKGADPERRLVTASRAGAYAVTVDGDWEGSPTYDELAALAAGGGTVMR